MIFDTEKAATALRAAWLETLKQGHQIDVFGQRLNVRKARTGGDQAVTKISQFMMKAAE